MSQDIQKESFKKQLDQSHSVSFPTKFLLFCAGAKTHHIYKSECEKDRSKYASIGATILITAIMAGISGGYALFTIFQSPAIATALGSFWGITIFNLDRSFTSTTKKTKNNKDWPKQTLATGIRLSLATLVGLVIAKPFEIKVFESKINETIARETLVKNRETRDSTFEASRIEELKNDLSQLESDAKDKEAEWLEWEDLANKEAEGIVGTGLRGKGIVYDEKKETATQLRQQLKDLRDGINRKEEEIIRFEQLQSDTIAEIKDVTKITIVDQLSTLHRLAEEEDIIFWSSLAISSLLFDFRRQALAVSKEAQIQALKEKYNQYLIQGKSEIREKTTFFLMSKLQELEKKIDILDDEFNQMIEEKTLKVEAIKNPRLRQAREKDLNKTIDRFIDLKEESLKSFEAIISEGIKQ